MQIEKKYLSLPLTAQLEITDYCNHHNKITPCNVQVTIQTYGTK